MDTTRKYSNIILNLKQIKINKIMKINKNKKIRPQIEVL